jgi:beta-glucanase (GH16 family)
MIALLIACAAPTEEAPGGFAWTEVWADRFDGTAGDAPAEPWVPDLGAGGWGNDELQHYTAENAMLDGQGHLVITARQEAREGAAYTSARLTTNGTYAHGAGRFEARIRVPEGQGLWPAFWLLGNDYDDVSWPACGELDAMEVRGGDPDTTQAAVHGPGFSGGGAIYDTYTLPEGSLADDFHTYAVQVDPDRVSFWFDEVRVHDVTPGDLPEGAAWPFDKEFFMLLNLAVGGTFGGDPDATTAFPAELVVDEVRVLERTEAR